METPDLSELSLSNLHRLRIDFEPREDLTFRLSAATTAFNILAAIVFGAIAIALAGTNPFAAFGTVASRLMTFYGISEVITRSIPLILLGLAVWVPRRANLWNVAGDAQIYAGGIIATWIGINVAAPQTILILVIIAVSGIAGAIIGFIPGYLRARWNVNEILTTLLLTFSFIQFNEYGIQQMPAPQLIHGSAPITENAYFPRFPGTRVHIGLLIALLGAVGVYLLINRTEFGAKVLIFGDNEEAAKQAGINKYTMIVGTFVIGGMLAGMAGAGEIGGIHRRLQPQWSDGMGFTGIAIALLGRSRVIYVLGGAVLFGALFMAGTAMETHHDVPFAIVDMFEAVVILFLVAAEFVRRFKIDIILEEEI
jgi:simple sugar transport system permease protein